MPAYTMRCDGLSKPEYLVAGLVADGFTNKQIAAKLNVTVQTVQWHLQAIVRNWELDPTRNYRVQITHRMLAQRPQPDPLQLSLSDLAAA